MSKIRGTDTGPEKSVRSALFRMGCRFRKHPKGIPGRPDIAHKTSRVAVFIDGCFWHGCPKHYRAPRSRVEYWTGRLEYNRGLRSRVREKLEGQGWAVLEIWECDTRLDSRAVASRIRELVETRRDRLMTRS